MLQLKEINPALPESALEQVRRHYEIMRRRPGWVFMVRRGGGTDP